MTQCEAVFNTFNFIVLNYFSIWKFCFRKFDYLIHFALDCLIWNLMWRFRKQMSNKNGRNV
jgi:hypothetical protein